jgi:hypothetical protein
MNRRNFLKGILAAPFVLVVAKVLVKRDICETPDSNKIGYYNINNPPVGTCNSEWALPNCKSFYNDNPELKEQIINDNEKIFFSIQHADDKNQFVVGEKVWQRKYINDKGQVCLEMKVYSSFYIKTKNLKIIYTGNNPLYKKYS